MLRRHLPEIRRVTTRDDRGEVDIAWIRLELGDGSTIVVYGLEEDGYRCRRRRLNGEDYSDRPEDIPIEPDLRRRLETVFGSLNFGDEA